MNRRVRFFGALLLAILLLMTACERGQEESSAPETTEATIGETVAVTEPEKTMTQEERNQLYRRVDYAVVGQIIYTGGYWKGYQIFDADQDDAEELFISCEGKALRGAIFAFDYNSDNKPFAIGHVNHGASGMSYLECMHTGNLVLRSSYGSGGVGTMDVYNRWNGENWEEFAYYHIKKDFEAMQDSDEVIYSIRDIRYEGKDVEEEDFFQRIDALGLKPVSGDLKELLGTTWIGIDIEDFIEAYADHLVRNAVGTTMYARGDIDGDGMDEALWYLDNPVGSWMQNLQDHQDAYNLTPEVIEKCFEGSDVGVLILADGNENQGLVSTALAPVTGIRHMQIENGEIVFDLEGAVQAKYKFAGLYEEIGTFILKEIVSLDEIYLRTGAWYFYSPQDTFVNVFHFEEGNKGYTTQRKTETGEELDYGNNFQYAVSSDGQRVVITYENGDTREFNLYLDTEFGAVLASDILYDILPDGSEVPFQSIIWRYPEQPTIEEMLRYYSERRGKFILPSEN